MFQYSISKPENFIETFQKYFYTDIWKRAVQVLLYIVVFCFCIALCCDCAALPLGCVVGGYMVSCLAVLLSN